MTSPVVAEVSQSDTLNRTENAAASVIRESEETAENSRLVANEDDDDDGSIQDGSLSRCHNRSVSHDSYFRLLMTSRTGLHADPLDEEGDSACADATGYEDGQPGADAIYAEISKPGTKSKSSSKCQFSTWEKFQNKILFLF